MLKDLIYVQETEYCPEDQCDFAIQEDYRLYDNSTAGTLIIGMINNGLNLIGVSPAWKNIILGLIIITAVVMDIMRSRKASRA